MACLKLKSDIEEATLSYSRSVITRYFTNGIQKLHSDGGGMYAFLENLDQPHT